jgi:hypothetical protein
MITSTAEVPTAVPGRFAKQLVSHLGHRLAFVTEAGTSTARIGPGWGSVIVGSDVLTLIATGPDEASVAAVEHVLGSHLERFGERQALVVRWNRT